MNQITKSTLLLFAVMFSSIASAQYKYFPKNKEELLEAISPEIAKQGASADLNCINTHYLCTQIIKNMKKFIFVLFPFFMCSCPGNNCVEGNEPNGYVVKMKNDYTDKVIVRMFISSISKDTTYCCETLQNHTIKICGDYYLLHCSYDIVAYTRICSKDWNETMMDSISNYILDTNPFNEVYAYYRKYEQNELKEIIETNSLSKLNRLK